MNIFLRKKSRAKKFNSHINFFPTGYSVIDDVVEAWFRASTYSSALGQTLNLGTGIKTKVGGLLEMVCELVPGSSYFVQGTTPGDQSGIFADVTKLSSCLGMKSFVPVDIGLRKFVEWARKSKFSLTK